MTATRRKAKGRAPKRSHARPIEVLFVAGFGPIAREPERSQKLYGELLGLPFEEADGGYLHTDRLDGTKSFGLWPLAQAAESCFGTSEWPGSLPVPQAGLEFDVADLRAATETLRRRGYELLVEAREEPWGQTVTRLLSPEGLLVAVTHTPWLRKRGQ